MEPRIRETERQEKPELQVAFDTIPLQNSTFFQDHPTGQKKRHHRHPPKNHSTNRVRKTEPVAEKRNLRSREPSIPSKEGLRRTKNFAACCDWFWDQYSEENFESIFYWSKAVCSIPRSKEAAKVFAQSQHHRRITYRH